MACVRKSRTVQWLRPSSLIPAPSPHSTATSSLIRLSARFRHQSHRFFHSYSLDAPSPNDSTPSWVSALLAGVSLFIGMSVAIAESVETRDDELRSVRDATKQAITVSNVASAAADRLTFQANQLRLARILMKERTEDLTEKQFDYLQRWADDHSTSFCILRASCVV